MAGSMAMVVNVFFVINISTLIYIIENLIAV